MRCAEIGNSRALFHIGYAYWSNGGWGLKEDKKKAADCFKKSSQLGSSHAMVLYAYCLLEGDGVEEDKESGYSWVKKALSTKDSFAVGFCHYWGFEGIISQSNSLSFEYMEVSAKGGDEYGQRFFGTLIELGYGPELDNEDAFLWYLKSAEQGLASSAHRVAKMLEEGKGCKKNVELSKMWFKKVQNQGRE